MDKMSPQELGMVGQALGTMQHYHLLRQANKVAAAEKKQKEVAKTRARAMLGKGPGAGIGRDEGQRGNNKQAQD